MRLLKTIVIAAATMFVVGALLGLAAPTLAAALGYGEPFVAGLVASSPPLWMGAFFAGFGALNAIIAPLVGRVFGAGTPSNALTGDANAPTRHRVQQHAPSAALEQAPERSATHFSDRIAAEREAADHAIAGRSA